MEKVRTTKDRIKRELADAQLKIAELESLASSATKQADETLQGSGLRYERFFWQPRMRFSSSMQTAAGYSMSIQP
ncbi:MAG TPA: hypothetical protein VMU10_01290 [Desulfomonilia bacterium]|nr:hypothetical protein [Desulfomonilia bacterium]